MRKEIVLGGAFAMVGAAGVCLLSVGLPYRALEAQESGLPSDASVRSDARPGDQRAFTPPLQPGGLTPEEQVHVSVYEAVNESVVHINTRMVNHDNFFFLETEAEGAGSGAVYDREGHILTNFHVVEDAEQIAVTLGNGKPFRAEMVGHDLVNDLAVLKIDAPPSLLRPVVMGRSAGLRVGQRVYTIGSPFELERTFTTGIVSSLDRTLPSRRRGRIMKSIIQVDAAMNPGNSGGPLVDTSARMIGMNTAIASKTGQNTGVGFAIPVDRIRRIVPELIRLGKVTRPDVGITSVSVTERGLLIRTLARNGPAEQAGLQGFRRVRYRQRRGPFVFEQDAVDPSAADIIVAVAGQKVRTLDDFESVIEDHKPGDDVVITILRDENQLEVTVRLRPGDD